eukprot:353225-Chlamydomonas_euryale.AAC.3
MDRTRTNARGDKKASLATHRWCGSRASVPPQRLAGRSRGNPGGLLGRRPDCTDWRVRAWRALTAAAGASGAAPGSATAPRAFQCRRSARGSARCSTAPPPACAPGWAAACGTPPCRAEGGAAAVPGAVRWPGAARHRPPAAATTDAAAAPSATQSRRRRWGTRTAAVRRPTCRAMPRQWTLLCRPSSHQATAGRTPSAARWAHLGTTCQHQMASRRRCPRRGSAAADAAPTRFRCRSAYRARLAALMPLVR